MDESSRPAANRRVRTQIFENRTDLLISRDPKPLHEQGRYDMPYNYGETAWPAANFALPPAAPAAEPPTVPRPDPTPSIPPPEYSSAWEGINSSPTAVPFANPGTPPEDPFTPPADLDAGFFPFQPPGAGSAGAAYGSIASHTHVSDQFHPAALGFSGSGQLPISTTLCTSANTNPAVNTAESLDRISSVPMLLSVTYLHGHYKGSTNYHYLLPPPPVVDLVHLHGGGMITGPPMLPVSADTREGLPREAWLDVGMDVVWEELMMSLIAEYAGSIGDIGLSIWEWRWVKTEWNMEVVSPHSSLKDIIQLFLLTEPAAGAPLILSPVLGDDIPYSDQPSVEFEVSVVSRNSYYEDTSLGNNQINGSDVSLQNPELMISNVSPLQGWCRIGNSHTPAGGSMGQNRSGEVSEGMGGDDHFDNSLNVDESVGSPGTLAHPSPMSGAWDFGDSVVGPPSSISGILSAEGPIPLPAYWIRTGNSYMLMGESREECERIMNARGIGCRFIEYPGR